jgi:hypothetical protein
MMRRASAGLALAGALALSVSPALAQSVLSVPNGQTVPPPVPVQSAPLAPPPGISSGIQSQAPTPPAPQVPQAAPPVQPLPPVITPVTPPAGTVPPATGAQVPAPAGAPATGQPATGQPATGQPAAGQAIPGQTAPGQPAPGTDTGQPAAPATSPQPSDVWVQQGSADLILLDKVNVRRQEMTIKVGQSGTFGSLTIAVRSCVIRPPDQAPDAAAFLDITDSRGGPGFQGWMIKSDPSLSMLQHPVYDVRVAGCGK